MRKTLTTVFGLILLSGCAYLGAAHYDELFGEELGASTLLIDYSLDNGWNQYNNIISDHRPMGISLLFIP